ncbi:hypothetical protein BS78_05G094600 [Paspalum vaginatum]|nr:hypothetical protein BS78_05G094600 [Paspalum vaginatum]
MDSMDCEQHATTDGTAAPAEEGASDAPLPSQLHPGIQDDQQLLGIDGLIIIIIPLGYSDEEEEEDDIPDPDGHLDEGDDEAMAADGHQPRSSTQEFAPLARHRTGTVAIVVVPLNGSAPLGEGGYSNGGFGAVPAPAAAVAGLKKREFRAGSCQDAADPAAAGCRICFEEFEDGEEVSVMPCSGGHEFHTPCIAKWLGVSNACPLCRHQLFTAPVV